MKLTLLATAALVALSACAERSANIAPSYASRAVYDPLTCAQIRSETNVAVTRLNSLTGAQDKKATTDAVLTATALVVFWPALLFTSGVSGSDNSAEIADLKGETEALQASYRAKGCGVPAA